MACSPSRVRSRPREQPQQLENYFTLLVFPFSLYAIMVRLTVALGQSAYPSSVGELHIQHRLVNLHRDENISQEYLLTVNPKGQVPTLTGAALPSPLADSLDISTFLCRQFFPSLLGGEVHKFTITGFLSKLHSIQALSLSVAREACVDLLPCPAVDALLARSTIDAKYRQALESKKAFHKANQATALDENHVKQAEDEAREFFNDILGVLYIRNDEAEPPWILGPKAGPTVLDAHCAPFIARLLDCGRQDIVPGPLQMYGRRIMSRPEWHTVTHGRPTMWDVSMGHVHLLNPV